MTNKEKLLKAGGYENENDAIIEAFSNNIRCIDCPVWRDGKCKSGGFCEDKIKKYLEEDDKNETEN